MLRLICSVSLPTAPKLRLQKLIVQATTVGRYQLPPHQQLQPLQNLLQVDLNILDLFWVACLVLHYLSFSFCWAFFCSSKEGVSIKILIQWNCKEMQMAHLLFLLLHLLHLAVLRIWTADLYILQLTTIWTERLMKYSTENTILDTPLMRDFISCLATFKLQLCKNKALCANCDS